MPRPIGRPKKLGKPVHIRLSDEDCRRVDLLCAILKVGRSEFFHLLLVGSAELAHESLDRTLQEAK